MNISSPIIPEFEAGVIAIREGSDNDEVLLIERNAMSDITIPKGHSEINESLQDTAIREVKEETGYDVELVSFLDSFEYYVPSENQAYLRRVYCFLANTKGKPEEITAKIEVKSALWIPIDESIERVSYPEIKILIKKGYKKYLSM